MRLRVQTQSGSIYRLDQSSMSWERINDFRGHEDIIGLAGVKSGLLQQWPVVQPGVPMHLYIGDGVWVNTTPVQLVEVTEP